jgi:GTP-binding protein
MKHIAPICRALLVQPWEIIPYSSEDGFGREKLLEVVEDVLYGEDEANEAPAEENTLES